MLVLQPSWTAFAPHNVYVINDLTTLQLSMVVMIKMSGYLIDRDLLPIDVGGVHYCHMGVAVVKVTGCVPWHWISKPIVKLPTALGVTH